MAWLEFSHWMSGSECADFWAGLVHRANDNAYKANESQGVAANTVVGFAIAFQNNCTESAVNIFLIDPLRFGEGFGSASAGGSKLGILSDIGRGMAFVPIGELGSAGVRAVGADAKLASATVRTASVETRIPFAAAGRDVRLGADAIRGVVPNRSAAEAIDAIGGLFRESDRPNEAICWAISFVRALQKAGRYHMRLDDVVRLVLGEGRSVAELEQGFRCYAVAQLSPLLDRLGIRGLRIANNSLRAGSVDQQLAEGLARLSNRNGVMIFGVEYGNAGHVLFCRMEGGQLRIFDRSGNVVHSLTELDRMYPGISAGHMKPNDYCLFIEDAGRLDKAALAIALQQRQIISSGLFGPVSIPVQFFPALMRAR